jgi:hypothetical protein
MTNRKTAINDLQNTTQKTTDRATGTTLKPGAVNSVRVNSSCTVRGTRRVTLVFHMM